MNKNLFVCLFVCLFVVAKAGFAGEALTYAPREINKSWIPQMPVDERNSKIKWGQSDLENMRNCNGLPDAAIECIDKYIIPDLKSVIKNHTFSSFGVVHLCAFKFMDFCGYGEDLAMEICAHVALCGMSAMDLPNQDKEIQSEPKTINYMQELERAKPVNKMEELKR